MELISIICPFYNASNYITRALESILTQTYNNWELIIVDDQSDNNEYILLQDYISQYKRRTSNSIKFLRTPKNSGPGVARNLGVEHAHGEYLCFLDADDSFYPQKLEKQLFSLKKNKSDLIFSRTIKRFENVDEITDYTWALEKIENDPILISIRCFIDTISTLIKKSAFKDVGGFEPWYYGEDKFLYFKLAVYGHSFTYLHDCITGVHYILKSNNLSRVDKKRAVELYYENIFVKMYSYLLINNIEKAIYFETISDKLYIGATELFQKGIICLAIKQYRKALNISTNIQPRGNTLYKIAFNIFGFTIAESTRLMHHKLKRLYSSNK